VRFEKWQALGNDYVIVEREALTFDLTPERVRVLCAAHTGVGADGVLELSPTDEPGFVAALRVFNPDGSEAELSGNGAREAILYLRSAGWTDQRQFSIRTAAGELRPTILSDTTCTVDMGRARDEGTGEIAGFRYQQVNVGNPQCSIRVGSEAELAALPVA
jgi:diaminopimelate epimerase